MSTLLKAARKNPQKFSRILLGMVLHECNGKVSEETRIAVASKVKVHFYEDTFRGQPVPEESLPNGTRWPLGNGASQAIIGKTVLVAGGSTSIISFDLLLPYSAFKAELAVGPLKQTIQLALSETRNGHAEKA